MILSLLRLPELYAAAARLSKPGRRGLHGYFTESETLMLQDCSPGRPKPQEFHRQASREQAAPHPPRTVNSLADADSTSWWRLLPCASIVTIAGKSSIA